MNNEIQEARTDLTSKPLLLCRYTALASVSRDFHDSARRTMEIIVGELVNQTAGKNMMFFKAHFDVYMYGLGMHVADALRGVFVCRRSLKTRKRFFPST